MRKKISDLSDADLTRFFIDRDLKNMASSLSGILFVSFRIDQPGEGGPYIVKSNMRAASFLSHGGGCRKKQGPPS